MQNNYILKNKNNEILSFYYGEERAIYCKKLDSNNNQITSKIIQDVTDCFTVTLSPNKDIYIFCQTYNGDIILCRLEENSFKNKILFKNKNEVSQNILFQPIFFKGNMSLIYNTTVPNNNNSFLSIKTLVGGKNWTNTENIDTFTPLSNNIFYIQKITEENIVLAYQKKNKDIQIGYKEIKNGNISDFITIHKTGYQIVDYSFVCFQNTIHYLYVIKSLFSSQVIYKKKDENGISSPIILFEGQKIKSCNINILENNLYCSFIVNSTLYYCQSEDFGNSFLGISKYRKPISQDVIKARFITDNNIGNSSINDVYIDSRNSLNIYLLPEILPSLFNRPINTKNQDSNINVNQDNFITNLNNQIIENENIEKNVTKEDNVPKKPVSQIKNTVTLENDFMSNFNLEEFSKFNINKENFNIQRNDNISTTNNNAQILENKVKMLNQQLNEKNSQILKLNDIIQNKNNERTDIEVNLRQKIKNMQNENSSLLEKISTLEKEIENIKNINKSIESEDIKQNDEPISKTKEQNQED